MKLSVDSSEPLDHVLRVIGSLYNVSLSVAPLDATDGKAEAANTVRSAGRSSRARNTGSRGATKGTRTRTSRKKSGVSNSQVRSWARQNGHQVSDRGRVPASVLAAYQEAQQPA